MKITLEDITAVELLAVAMVLNKKNINEAPIAESAPVVESDNSAVIGEIGTIEEIVNEPTGDTMDFDKEGLPWDERIHSSSHKLTSQGVWARRRNITDEVYNAVKAELLAKWGSAEPITENAPVMPSPYEPQPIQAFVPVQEAPAPIVAPEPVQAPAFVPVQQTPAPVVAPAPVAPVASQAEGVSLLQTMMDKLKSGIANKLIEANYMQSLINTVNTIYGTSYKGMNEMRDRNDVMQYVINELAKKGI